MDNTNKPAAYTVDQLMQLSNSGTCQVQPANDADRVCADVTQAAITDPSTLKIAGTKRVRFQVRNNNTESLYFGFGQSLSKPGLSALYPDSVFANEEGVNASNFFAGDSLIPAASAPNSLATQSKCQINPRMILSRIAIVNVNQADAILLNNMQFERTAPSNGKATTEEVSPECNACGGTSASNLITAAFDIALTPADERNAVGLLIPAVVAEGDVGTLYTIDVDIAFTEGAYGYVAVSGGKLNG